MRYFAFIDGATKKDFEEIAENAAEWRMPNRAHVTLAGETFAVPRDEVNTFLAWARWHMTGDTSAFKGFTEVVNLRKEADEARAQYHNKNQLSQTKLKADKAIAEAARAAALARRLQADIDAGPSRADALEASIPATLERQAKSLFGPRRENALEV